MNYYNEYDKKAAAWLRELINVGAIAPGIVDERSIKDVRPNDLKGFTQCHFFAGIGVWSYALRRAGWPDSRSVWTGSCPCQPFSAAGRGDGVADERHLWPHFFQLIAQCRPPDLFGEQVASKDGLGWLDLVQADMEGAEYAFGSADLCAAGVGAPHIRQRLYFAAKALGHAASGGRREFGHAMGAGHSGHADGPVVAGVLAHAQQRGVRGEPGGVDRQETGAGDRQHLHDPVADGRAGSVAHAQRGDSGCEAQPTHHRQPQAHRPTDLNGGCGGASGSVAHTQRPGLQVRADADVCGTVGHDQGRLAVESGDGGAVVLADADGGHAGTERQQRGGQQRLVQADGRGLPDAAGGPGPTNGHWAAADWIFCRDGKWRPVEPGTFPLAHGAPERVGRLRGFGNAIVAPVAEVFIASYLDIEGVV